MTLGLGWRLSEVDMLGQGGTGAQYKPVVHVLPWLWCAGHSVAVAVQCCMQVGVVWISTDTTVFPCYSIAIIG